MSNHREVPVAWVLPPASGGCVGVPFRRCSAGGAKRRFCELRALAKSLATVRDPGQGTGTAAAPGSRPLAPPARRTAPTCSLRSCLTASSLPLMAESACSSRSFRSPSSFFLAAAARARCLRSSSSSVSYSWS